MRALILISLALVQVICRSSCNHNDMKERHVKTPLTSRPIIGIMTQSTKHQPFEDAGKSYIAASYIKFLESAGARVVPVRNDLSQDEVEKLFHSINGFLLPGGGVNLFVESGYHRVGEHIFNLALQSFDKGEYFPIWGVCLGFQLLSILASNDVTIRSATDSENLTLPLNFTSGYQNSRMFQDIPQDLAKFLSSAPSTLNMHHYSVLTEKFKANKKLSEFFHILSTNKDREGKEFVSTMEGVQYPIYGTQWHPEKNQFEWNLKENIPHEAMAIRATQYLANFFVNETRYSSHRFETHEQEEAALIYNYDPLNTGNISNFEQCYVFK